MPYMNMDTGDYPRFAGDVALDPNAHWEFVEETPAPPLGALDVLIEGAPVKDGKGVWRQTWEVQTLTQAQWDERRLAAAKGRLAAFGLTVEDLKTLLAEGA